MSKFSASDVLELPVTERLQLVEEIWDSIANNPTSLAVTEADRQLIDERLEACRKNPGAVAPAEEVLNRISQRRG